MYKNIRKIGLMGSIVWLSACGGGGGQPSEPSTPQQSLSQAISSPALPTASVKVSDDPVVDLSQAVAWVNYTRLLNHHASDSDASSEFVISGNTNVMGLDKEERSVPILNNITSLRVDYSVNSPQGDVIYLKLSRGSDQLGLFSESRGSFSYFDVQLQATDDSGELFSDINDLGLPVIHRSLVVDFPLSKAQIQSLYGEGAYFTEKGNRIVFFNQAGEEQRRIAKSEMVKSVKEALDKPLYCNVLKVTVKNNQIACLGGVTTVKAKVHFQPFEYTGLEAFEMDVDVSNIRLAGRSIRSGFDSDNLNKIRRGLKPIQFDDEGNRYLRSEKEMYVGNITTHIGQLLKVDENNVVTPAFSHHFDDEDVESFFVLPSGNITYRYQLANRNSSQSRVAYYQPTSESTIQLQLGQGLNRFQVDDYNTIYSQGLLFSENSDGGLRKMPLTYQGQNTKDIIVSDDGRVYACIGYYLRSILPFNEKALASDCDVNDYFDSSKELMLGYLVSIGESDAGEFGMSSTIHLQRLMDGQEYDLLSYDEYSSNTPRYTINDISSLGKKIFFSGKQLSPSATAITGIINLDKFSKNAPEAEFLTITPMVSEPMIENPIKSMMAIKREVNATSGMPPKVDQFHFDANYPMAVGLEFSEFMDKTSVLESLSLSNEEEPNLDYLPFWVGKRLYLLGASNGFNEGSAYLPFSHFSEYRLSLESEKIQDISGSLMLNGFSSNADRQFTFIDNDGFVRDWKRELVQFSNMDKYTYGVIAPFKTRLNNHGLFHIQDFPKNPRLRNYRLEFDYSIAYDDDNKTRSSTDIAFLLKDKQQEVRIEKDYSGFHNVYSFPIDRLQGTQYVPFNDYSAEGLAVMPAEGMAIDGNRYSWHAPDRADDLVNAFHSEWLNFNSWYPVPSSSDTYSTQPKRFRIDFFDGKMSVSVRELANEASEYQLISDYDLTIFSDDSEPQFWLAFGHEMHCQGCIHQLDNVSSWLLGDHQQPIQMTQKRADFSSDFGDFETLRSNDTRDYLIH